MFFSLDHLNIRNLNEKEKIETAIARLNKRTKFHTLLYQFVSVCLTKKIRLIIENPCSEPNYLITGQNFPKPTYIDKDRTRRGDYFKKPTAFWFFGCTNTNMFTPKQTPKSKQKTVCKAKKGIKSGICSEERSMISPEYAHNFICDNIIGLEQDYVGKQLELF